MRRILLLFPGVFSVLAGCDASDTKLVAACEGALKATLKSPSTYQRIEAISHANVIADRSAYEIRLMQEGYSEAERVAMLREFDAGSLAPTQFQLDLVYEAQNSLGATLRGKSSCRYFNPTDKSDERITQSAVRIES